ncbi:hypothetical protein [Acinetobacter sp. c1-l78]|uniref:hypothetical protein n=1 Tax=Acinetobacter sp. c1-l78 TaxID=3342803 RepID=UPI0035B89DCA
MSTKKTVNLCAFGLSLRALNDFKSLVDRLVSHQTTINWKNISEPNLDALFINELFFETPSIQNLVKNNNLNVLRLATKPEKNSIIEGDILYLPIMNSSHFETWFNKNILSNTTPSSTRSSFDETSHSRFETTQQNTPVANNYNVGDKLALLRDLFNPQNGKALVFDQRGQIGVLDPRTEQFWSNPENLIRSTDNSLNFTFAKMNDTLKYGNIVPQDMKFWLFDLLWHSPDYMTLAPEQGYLKLKYWPQPKHEADKRDILRLSACFAKGAEIKQVAKQLNIPVTDVRQFVSAALGADLIYAIEATDAKFATTDVDVKSENLGAIRKFFGGLRRRLGL